jgi:hypothetical protein
MEPLLFLTIAKCFTKNQKLCVNRDENDKHETKK